MIDNGVRLDFLCQSLLRGFIGIYAERVFGAIFFLVGVILLTAGIMIFPLDIVLVLLDIMLFTASIPLDIPLYVFPSLHNACIFVV